MFITRVWADYPQIKSEGTLEIETHSGIELFISPFGGRKRPQFASSKGTGRTIHYERFTLDNEANQSSIQSTSSASYRDQHKSRLGAASQRSMIIIRRRFY